MGGKMSNKRNFLEKSVEEITALSHVIKYAERMINEGQYYPYYSLRRHAYGKTVVINSEVRGDIEYRLSSTSAVIVPNSVGYATPHSPIGRLCSFVDHGYLGESLLLGEFRVSEVRKFDRFDGVNFEENVYNFLRMQVINDESDEKINNLLEYIACKRIEPKNIHEPEIDKAPNSIDETLIDISNKEADLDNIKSVSYGINEDDDENKIKNEIEIDVDLDVIEDNQNPIKSDIFFGLNEAFYLNRTYNQNKVIARTPVGPMMVLGIAGSGKTSAALGRTKMLCDFSVNNVSTKEEFEAVLDSNHDYWDGKYAGKFSQEGSVGFVRTGELIQYLKETCRRIDLPNLPVCEYRELQIRLKIFRGIDNNNNWKINNDLNAPIVLCSIDWFQSALKAMSLCVKTKIEENSLIQNTLISKLIEDQTSSSSIAYQNILKNTKNDLKSLFDSAMESDIFWFDGLIEKLRNIIEKNVNNVLGKNAFWVKFNGNYKCIEKNEFAENILNEKKYIFDNNKNIILFYKKNENDCQFINDAYKVYMNIVPRKIGEKKNITINDKSYIVSDLPKSELMTNYKLVSLNDLLLDIKIISDIKYAPHNINHILPDDVMQIVVKFATTEINSKATLTEIDFFTEMHIQPDLRLYILDKINNSKLELLEAKFYNGENFDKKITINKTDIKYIKTEFKNQLIKNFIDKIFKDILGLYYDSLKSFPDVFCDKNACDYLVKLFNKKSINNESIDLILSTYHLISTKCSSSDGIFSCPKYYQSVFIDEMQDFTELQIFLMSMQADPKFNSVTIVGDYAQKIKNETPVDVEKCFPDKYVPTVRLNENLRQLSSPRLAALSSIFRKEFIDDIVVPEELLVRAKNEQKHKYLNDVESVEEFDLFIITKLQNLNQFETAAVIFPNHETANIVFSRLHERLDELDVSSECSMHIDISRKYVKHFTGVENTKGLEFDYVLLVNIEKYMFEEAIWKNRFYVGITRASKRLDILVLGKSLNINLLRKLGDSYNKLLNN